MKKQKLSDLPEIIACADPSPVTTTGFRVAIDGALEIEFSAAKAAEVTIHGINGAADLVVPVGPDGPVTVDGLRRLERHTEGVGALITSNHPVTAIVGRKDQ